MIQTAVRCKSRKYAGSLNRESTASVRPCGNRRKRPWCQTTSSTTDSNTDTSAGTVTPLTLLIQKLAAIHAAEPALHSGRYQELLLTNRQYAFARHGDHQAILTAANNDDNAAYLQVPLPFHTTAEQATDLITGKSFLIDKNTNKIQIELEGNSAVILGITEG